MKIEGTNRRYQFFITDHLGSTRAIVEKVGGTTTLVQENHYGVWGETLAGLSSNGDWIFLFQGKEYIDFEGYKLYDFHTRGYDPWTGRFWQMDGPNQFASGYVGMGNNPVSFVDPDGQWVHVLIGGVTNLVSNWGNINGNFWKGVGYFGIGAVAGAVGAGVGAGVNVAIAGGSFSAGFWGTASGVASTGFFSGLATGASAGFSNGFLSGTGNGLMQGNSLGSSLGSGFRTGGMQGAFGGVTGGRRNTCSF